MIKFFHLNRKGQTYREVGTESLGSLYEIAELPVVIYLHISHIFG